MINARFVRDEALRSLRADVSKRLEAYRSGNFGSLVQDSSLFFETSLEIDEERLGGLSTPEGANLFEVENCIAVFSSMPLLTPYDARDERLWVYLTHTVLLEHARKRWPIPSDDVEAEKHIHKHFFASDRRQTERDNAVSRLWWMAHLCDRVEGLTLEEALKAFLFRSDVRANIIERPTISQATNVFGAIVKRLSMSLRGKQNLFERKRFRQLMMEINSVGGFRLLDCLSEADVGTIVDDAVRDRLQVQVL